MLRAKSGALRNSVKSLAEFSFIDAPHACRPRSATVARADDDAKSPPSSTDNAVAEAGRAWFTFDDLESGGSLHLGGLEASFAAVAAAWEASAPSGGYDGIFGFSQGAAVVAALALAQAYNAVQATTAGAATPPPLSPRAQALAAAARPVAFRCCVMVSGFVPNDASLLELAAQLPLPLALPSLHVYGTRDVLVSPVASAGAHCLDPSEALAAAVTAASSGRAAAATKTCADSASAAAAEGEVPSAPVVPAVPAPPRHKRMLVTLPGAGPLFSPAKAVAAVHGGGHLVPTDAAVRSSFKAFLASVTVGSASAASVPAAASVGDGASSGGGGSGGSSTDGAPAAAKSGKAPKTAKSGKAPKATAAAGGRAGGGGGSDSPGGVGRRRVVLMLHGFTQDAALFEHRCSNLARKVLKPLGLEPRYLDAPFACPSIYAAADRDRPAVAAAAVHAANLAAATAVASEAPSVSPTEASSGAPLEAPSAGSLQRAWFVPGEMTAAVRPANSAVWVGWEEALAGIEASIASREGDAVVGVVGFSQGALMAAMLLAKASAGGSPATRNQLRFALLICSGDAHDPAAATLMATGSSGSSGGSGNEGEPEQPSEASPSKVPLLGAPPLVLCVCGDADPLVTMADCRTLADRLAARLGQHTVCEAATAAVPWDGGGGAPAEGRVAFLTVSGGHGLPPNRDMASIKSFVACALRAGY